MKEKHPDWALAYILQDLTRNGRPAVKKAYEASCDGSGVSPEETKRLLDEALRKMRVYVVALEEVGAK